MQAQELKTHVLFTPESKDNKDLYFLNKELQNKQLVMLGEMTHMYGNIFEMKARIIEYLHEELGYTTIAMESSMYDIWLMNKNGFSSKGFNDAIWGVWSNSQEFQRLVTYIEKNKLKVVGFDSQINNSSKFIEDLFGYLKNKDIQLKLDEDDMAIIIEGIIENASFDEDDIKFSSFQKELKRIIQLIDQFESSDLNYNWSQFIKNLLTSSKDTFYNTKQILTTDFGNNNHNYRDQQMADNLLAYMARHKDEKIICWADNIHIINDISSVKKPVIKDFIPMGTYIKRILKDKVYSLATLQANDSLLEKTTWHSTPILEGSFEYELKTLHDSYLFITSNQEAMRKTQQSRLLDFIDFTEARLDQLYDGYIFIENAKIPKNKVEIPKENNLNKALESTGRVKLIPNEKEEIQVLKGQIIDSKTNLPIPYSNIIMKNEEIYRVADERGNFELPLTKEMIENTLVSISSMGYENRIIPINKLTSKINLSPKFDELDEVIITANMSPLVVLKKAIKNKKNNHPITPFNFRRYASVIVNKNDKTVLDLELISKEYDQGYLSPFILLIVCYLVYNDFDKILLLIVLDSNYQ
jgi:erythromycin esterase-like protein